LNQNTLLAGILLAFPLVLSPLACRTSTSGLAENASGIRTSELNGAFQMGVKDVSFFLTPRQGLTFSSATSESVIFPKSMFTDTLKLAGSERANANDSRQFENYEDWVIAGVRIDTCARVLASLPCQPQVRLVAQPVERSGEFRDHAIHLAFNVDSAKRLDMLQDFVDLKKDQANPVKTLDLPSLVRKYALTSKLERVAVMLTVSRVWTFAATQTVVDGKILAAPVPCVGAPSVSLFASELLIPRGIDAKIQPEPNCPEMSIPLLATEDLTSGKWNKAGKEEKEQEVRKAIRINDPTKVFFGSTDCVSCHIAGRALLRAKGSHYLDEDPRDPDRFQRAEELKSEGAFDAQDHYNAWGTRAFGYGQNGKVKAMSLYTFNDSLRVAHEINELLRSGELKK